MRACNFKYGRSNGETMGAILAMFTRAPMLVIIMAITAFLLVQLGYDLVRTVLIAIFVTVFLLFFKRVVRV